MVLLGRARRGRASAIGKAHLTRWPPARGPVASAPVVRTSATTRGMTAPAALRRARFAELTPFEVYGLCRLRVDVFVVEQECPYPELDGRDVEPATVHVWFEAGRRRSLATIRVLDDGETRAIGRVATAAGCRGPGLAARLMEEGIALCAGFPVTLGAQAYLEGWYERFGFRRAARATSRTASRTCPCAASRRDRGHGAATAAADRLEALAARTTPGDWRVGGLLASRPEVVAHRPGRRHRARRRGARAHRRLDRRPLPRRRRPAGRLAARGRRRGPGRRRRAATARTLLERLP